MNVSKEQEAKCLALAVPARRSPVGYSPVQTLVIDGWHPTKLNRLLGCHWAVAAKHKSADRAWVEVAAKGKRKAAGKRRVSLGIVLGPRQRAADPDAYWKSLLDALVLAGMLVNDNRQHCELGPVRFSRGVRPATVVTLEDMP